MELWNADRQPKMEKSQSTGLYVVANTQVYERETKTIVIGGPKMERNGYLMITVTLGLTLLPCLVLVPSQVHATTTERSKTQVNS